eukprot:5445715-Prymnesium_polylepis.1
MPMSLCVLALHGWVAKDGNYSEKIDGECGGGGCGSSCMVSLNIVVEEQRARLPKGYGFCASEHTVRRRVLDAVELRKELKEVPSADKKILEQGFGMNADV